MTNSEDKAGQEYWNALWAADSIPDAVNPRQTGLDNYANRRLHEYFVATFSGVPTRELTILEIGCARSVWLPYLAREFGFRVYGLDYSELGCEQARQVLARAGVSGEITQVDFFAPPEDMIGAFDVVISFGVAEHFVNTAECIAAFARFLKPGGLLITMIPNMVGWVGVFQKLLNPPVFAIHVLLDSTQLERAHELAGLRVLHSEYFLSINFGVCNLNGISPHSPEWFIKMAILKFLFLVTKIAWVIEQLWRPFPPRRFLAPYIICTATR